MSEILIERLLDEAYLLTLPNEPRDPWPGSKEAASLFAAAIKKLQNKHGRIIQFVPFSIVHCGETKWGCDKILAVVV